MSRILLRLAALSAVWVAVSSCNDATTAPTPEAPKAVFSVSPTTPINQAVTDLINQIYTGGPRTEVSAKWKNITDKLEDARKKKTPDQQTQQANVGRKMLANLVSWIQSHTSDVTPPSGETREHVVARLVLYMSVYAYGDPSKPLPAAPPMGSDAVITVVDPNAATIAKTPEEHAAINLPQGAVAEPTVLVIYEDAGDGWARCSGPLQTTLCQYPHFYHFDIFPHVRLNTPARVGVCHVVTGPNAPLRDAEHDGRLRVAHDAPADPADNTPNAQRVEGVEILPLTDISDFLMCGHTATASRIPSHNGNSLADRGWRALDKLASAAEWLVVPKTAYAIDQGGGGLTLDFSTFEVLDPHSNDPPPADATGPVVTPVVTGTLNNGWYTSDVSVSWTVTDAESGIISPECTGGSVTSNTAEQTFTCAATSAGGTTIQSVTIKRDATAPTVTPKIAGTLGADGWYTSDIGVTWSVADDLSGVGNSSGCSDVSITTDTDGISYTCSATNGAGLTSSEKVTVKRDATPPVVAPDVAGSLGNGGWYIGDVAVSWSVTDAQSGVGTTDGCGATYVSGDQEGLVVRCAAVDKAGNKATNGVLVRRDATPPVITPTVTGELGGDGWYTGNVNVSWVVTDATSRVSSTLGCDNASISEDTNGTKFTCNATDNAGNRGTNSVTIKRDGTAPVITPTVIGSPGAAGWYAGNVEVSWSVTDANSGVGSKSGCDNVTIADDTNGTTFTCNASDNAGNPGTNKVLIRKDATPPVVTPTVTGTRGADGWYTTDVHVSWSVADATSGVASSGGCEDANIAEDTEGKTFTCSATDYAGNVGTNSVTIKRDATPPAISPSESGPLSSSGWYTGDANVSWAVSDAMSGVASRSGCEHVVISEDTDGTTITCAGTDKAGNRGEKSVHVRRDATPPVITPSLNDAPPTGKWYTSSKVDVAWAVTDATSGVGPESGCEASSILEETPEIIKTCSATDNAGNTATVPVSIKHDATPPVITNTVDGAKGSPGWYTGDVTVTWFATDDISGVTTTCVNGSVTSDTRGETFNCSATNGAGLTSTAKPVTIKRDATAPLITNTIDGTKGAAGWYTSDVTVTWSATDDISGVTTTCSVGSLTSDSRGAPFNCSATNGAGLTSNAEPVIIKRDATAPVIMHKVDGTKGTDGWYTSDVTVTWLPTDDISGVTTTCAAGSVDSDTRGDNFSCSATNGAGLTSSAEPVTIKRDATKPVIGYSGNSSSYTVDQAVAITCSASDAMSGLAVKDCQNINGDAYVIGLGTHTYSASATDNASNSNSATAAFSVQVTSASLCALTRRFSTSADIASALCAKLSAYQASIGRGSSISAAGQISAYINQVQAQTGKAVTSTKAATLISLARAL